MKKAIIGVVSVGAVMALLPVVKRRMGQKMREHCKQMMAQFAGRSETTGPEAMGHGAMGHKMREHCEQMAAQHEDRGEPVATA